jgi:hypothetical protein
VLDIALPIEFTVLFGGVDPLLMPIVFPGSRRATSVFELTYMRPPIPTLTTMANTAATWPIDRTQPILLEGSSALI